MKTNGLTNLTSINRRAEGCCEWYSGKNMLTLAVKGEKWILCYFCKIKENVWNFITNNLWYHHRVVFCCKEVAGVHMAELACSIRILGTFRDLRDKLLFLELSKLLQHEWMFYLVPCNNSANCFFLQTQFHIKYMQVCGGTSSHDCSVNGSM